MQGPRSAIDAEIKRVRVGDLALLCDTALKGRFKKFATLARELLADFARLNTTSAAWRARA